jgi:hypothetical protein
MKPARRTVQGPSTEDRDGFEAAAGAFIRANRVYFVKMLRFPS